MSLWVTIWDLNEAIEIRVVDLWRWSIGEVLLYIGWLLGLYVLAIAKLISHINQLGYELVTVHTHDDFIVLPTERSGC